MSRLPVPGPAAAEQLRESAADRQRDAAAQLVDLAEDARFYVAWWQEKEHDLPARVTSLARAIERIDVMCRAAWLLRVDLVEQLRDTS